MKIVRERPCQRRHHRVTAPMNVTLPSGETSIAANWSLGGLRLDNLSQPLPRCGEQIILTLELPFQGFDISFEVSAKVMRARKKKNVLGVEFIELSERAHDLMEHFINDLVRGQMATVEDTICRIDVPVTPISTKPDTNPTGDVPIKRWPMKTIFMSSLYMCLGIFVFSYLAILIYSNTMLMEVQTAVVTSELKTIKMPVEGNVRPIKMDEGLYLTRGEPIAKIESHELERRLEAKHIEYDEKKRRYELSIRRYQIESQRLKLYEMASKTEEHIAMARLEAAQAALRAADAAVLRLNKFDRTIQNIEEKFQTAISRQEEMVARVEEAGFEHERAIAMSSVSDRRHFTDEGFIADLDLLTLDIEEANASLATAQSEIEYLERQKERLIIRAPFDGRILKVADLQHTAISKNQALLTLEKQKLPTVQAFLSQSEVLSIGLNDAADVYIPSIGRTISARVVKVDRNSGQISAEYSNFIWRENDAKSALVSLEFNIDEIQETDLIGGLPAVVIFSKRSTSNIYNAIGDVVSEVAEVFTNDHSV